MAWSRKMVIVAGLTTGAAVIAIAVLFNGGLTPACTPVGYADISPIELRIDPAMEAETVEACFGRDCQPVPLAADDDGGWSVPQAAQFLQGVEPGSVSEVKVIAESDDVTLVNGVFQVGQAGAEGEGFWRPCPGPMRYVPVQVSASSL